MVVLRGITHYEDDRHFGKEGVRRSIAKVGGSIEGKAVGRDLESLVAHQSPQPSIRVGGTGSDLAPGTITSDRQRDGNTSSRTPECRVQDVGGDGAHDATSFRSRSLVILRCSSAAFFNSSSGVFVSRL